jgi:hypothetical protein
MSEPIEEKCDLLRREFSAFKQDAKKRIAELEALLAAADQRITSMNRVDCFFEQITDIREPVKWFTQKMEHILRLHDDERGRFGWRNEGGEAGRHRLFMHLQSEVREAAVECYQTPVVNQERAIKELVDIANMAMMIADNLRGAKR